MTWQTNSSIITLRNVARRLGLNQIIGHLRPSATYEKTFEDALFAAIQPGDVVWDVGANVGYYTRKFAEAVGPNGQVVAFEPFPSTVERLRASLDELKTVSVREIALGAESGSITMKGGADALAATSQIVVGATGHGTTEVEISTGDTVVERGIAAAPNLVKIDTEGFELDVLHGMQHLLTNRILSAVFVEVHFGLLADRSMATAPQEIEQRLKETGFAIQWVDHSHIVGIRE